MDAMTKAATKQLQVPTNRINPLENYSSPYSVMVRKEISEQRKEEVDLETGKRKSWLETTEFEVLDLTGETPVNKKFRLVGSMLKDEEVTDEQGKVEKKKKEKKKKSAEALNAIVTKELTVKVKKKSKKDRQEKMESEAEVTVSNVANNEDFFNQEKKKSKKSKRSEEIEETSEEIKENTENEVTKKKKKSKKEKVEEYSSCENEENKSKETKKGMKEKVKEKKPTYSDEEKENTKKKKRKIDDENLGVPKKKLKKKINDAESTNTSSISHGNAQNLNRNQEHVSTPIRGGHDDSVIMLPDTPFPDNRRRRSNRMI